MLRGRKWIGCVELQVERDGRFIAVQVAGTVEVMDVRITRVTGLEYAELSEDEREWARGELLLSAKSDEQRRAELVPSFARRCA